MVPTPQSVDVIGVGSSVSVAVRLGALHCGGLGRRAASAARTSAVAATGKSGRWEDAATAATTVVSTQALRLVEVRVRWDDCSTDRLSNSHTRTKTVKARERDVQCVAHGSLPRT